MFFPLLIDYVRWHYGTALMHYLRILKTLWWFVTAYVAFSHLITTLFAPYRNIVVVDENKESQSWYMAFVTTTASRFMGAVVRLIAVFLGLCTLFFLTVVGILGYGLWLIAPLIPLVCFLVGSSLLVMSLVSYL